MGISLYICLCYLHFAGTSIHALKPNPTTKLASCFSSSFCSLDSKREKGSHDFKGLCRRRYKIGQRVFKQRQLQMYRICHMWERLGI